jgi:ubiquitin carboxyl-terminal hydrolase 4/11/15
MGLNGRVATEYAALVSNLWSGQEESSFSPYKFKQVIGEFNSMFAGIYQQDSQELLNSLLDGMHEDLNRVSVKPYTETPEMEGWADADIAKEMWRLYKGRNDSVIVDLFQGMYRSVVECLVCGLWI